MVLSFPCRMLLRLFQVPLRNRVNHFLEMQSVALVRSYRDLRRQLWLRSLRDRRRPERRGFYLAVRRQVLTAPLLSRKLSYYQGESTVEVERRPIWTSVRTMLMKLLNRRENSMPTATKKINLVSQGKSHRLVGGCLNHAKIQERCSYARQIL